MIDFIKINNKEHWNIVLKTTLLNLPILFFVLLNYQLNGSHHSDETHQQLIVENWLKFKNIIVTCGQDPFILKFPIYFVLHILFDNTPTILFLTGFSFLAIMLLLFNFLQFHFHKNILLGFSISLVFITNYYLMSYNANPNTRNFEIPLAMICAWIILEILIQNKIKEKFKFLIFFTIFILILTISDGYVFIIFASIFPTYFLLGIFSNKIKNFKFNLFFISAYLIFIFLILQLGLNSLNYLNIYPRKLPISINLEKAFFIDLPRINLDIKNLLSDKDYIQTPLIYIIFFLIIWQIIKNKNKLITALKDLNRNVIFSSFTLFMLLVNIFIFYFSGAREDDSKFRYLVLIIYALPLTIIGFKDFLENKKKIIFILFYLIAFYNLYSATIDLIKSPKIDIGYKISKKVEKFTQENQVTIGFADYWDSGMLNYYANGKLLVYPMFCPGSFQIDPIVLAHPKIESVMLPNIKYFIYVNNPHSHCSLDFIRGAFASKILKEEVYGVSEAIFLLNNI